MELFQQDRKTRMEENSFLIEKSVSKLKNTKDRINNSWLMIEIARINIARLKRENDETEHYL